MELDLRETSEELVSNVLYLDLGTDYMDVFRCENY